MDPAWCYVLVVSTRYPVNFQQPGGDPQESPTKSIPSKRGKIKFKHQQNDFVGCETNKSFHFYHMSSTISQIINAWIWINGRLWELIKANDVCVYIYLYILVYVYIYMYIYIYMYTYIYIYVYHLDRWWSVANIWRWCNCSTGQQRKANNDPMALPAKSHLRLHLLHDLQVGGKSVRHSRKSSMNKAFGSYLVSKSKVISK